MPDESRDLLRSAWLRIDAFGRRNPPTRATALRLRARLRPGTLVRTGTRTLRRARRYIRRQQARRRPLHHPVELANGSRRDAFVAALVARLDGERIPYTTGGRVDERRARFHFRDDDAGFVSDAIVAAARSVDATTWFKAARRAEAPIDRLAEACGTGAVKKFDIRIDERRISSLSSDSYRFYSIVEVDFWYCDENNFKGSGYRIAPRFNDVTTSVRRETFDDLLGAAGPTRPPTSDGRVSNLDDLEDEPNLFARDFPIDIVYTWVDDTDEEWRAIKAEYQPRDDAAGKDARRDLPERYRNRDELMYSLRSVDMFAPFVRKIFVVTMGQTPSWLDTSHPQIEMVDHRDIYADPSALPTFNSSSIETQLHHIDDLAEHFIYLNDDVFLGKACNWSEFFYANGAAKFFPAEHTIAASAIADGVEEYLAADRNAIELMKKRFGITVHRPMQHVPHAARRSVLYELEDMFHDAFEACQRERFRSPNDLRPIAFMGHHYGYYTGRAVPSSISQRYLALWKPVIAAQLDGVLRTRKYRAFCINDVGVTPEREAEVDALVGSFLERYFPVPSRFEKSG